jgi:NTP pyrophosphatase (non-canonical NTP hydrolase)
LIVDKGLSLNEIAGFVHRLAREKGFYDKEESDDAYVERACNNLHDEVSELHTAWRSNQLRELCDKADKMREAGIEPMTCLEEELADVIIRCCDNAIRLGVDIEDAVIRKHRYNQTRPHRHGNKRS